MVLFTLANNGDTIAVNPHFVTAIMRPEKTDADNVKARVFMAGDDEFAILVEVVEYPPDVVILRLHHG